ncbi:MAG: hypothetical protein KC983_08550 [Phycisphaerales bacterium]|nr:hypothetical protein [Phycisphaerales bacterium]
MAIMHLSPTTTISRPARRCLRTALALLICMLAGGCYRHVVAVDGVGGSNTVDVYEPNYTGEPLPGERAIDSIFGGAPRPKFKPSSIKK